MPGGSVCCQFPHAIPLSSPPPVNAPQRFEELWGEARRGRGGGKRRELRRRRERGGGRGEEGEGRRGVRNHMKKYKNRQSNICCTFVSLPRWHRLLLLTSEVSVCHHKAHIVPPHHHSQLHEPM